MRTASIPFLGYFSQDRNGQARRLEWKTFLTFGVVLPLGSLIGIYRIATTHVEFGVWITSFVLYWYTLLSITLYYHRTVTHRGLKLARPVELLFLVGGGFSLQGNAVDWVTKHRLHHGNSDIVGLDPHSPWEYPGWRGLLWAQWFWLFFVFELPKNHRVARDLRESRLIQWQASLTGFPLLTLLSFTIPMAVFGWNGLFIASILRMALLMTSTGFINSWCHMWGTRAIDSSGRPYMRDDSRNSWFVALVSGGEGNHSNHHADLESAQHGWRAKLGDTEIRVGRRYQPDFTWRVIQVLRSLRLATEVKCADPHIVFTDWALEPSRELRHIHTKDVFISRAANRILKRKLNEKAARDRARLRESA